MGEKGEARPLHCEKREKRLDFLGGTFVPKYDRLEFVVGSLCVLQRFGLPYSSCLCGRKWNIEHRTGNMEEKFGGERRSETVLLRETRKETCVLGGTFVPNFGRLEFVVGSLGVLQH